MNQQFTSAVQSINALGEYLRTVHKPYAGARFRIALSNNGNSKQFLTGSVVFSPIPVSPRPAASYRGVLMVEQWCPEQFEALSLLSSLLSGKAEIEGQKIDGAFNQSNLDRRTYPNGPELWTGLELRSARDRDPITKDVNLSQGLLTGFGMRPYLGPNHAINDWVFDFTKHQDYSADVPNQNYLVTSLPDTRCRIVSAQWIPGKLQLEIEMNVPKDHPELQIIQADSKQPYQAVAPDNPKLDISIPDDARSLIICLVDRTNECLSQISLPSLYATFGHISSELTSTARATMDLGRGENDRVEFKPFMQPNNEKETEFVESAIAFANTAGGFIYIGVNDRDGTPQGDVQLRKAFAAESKQAIDKQAERARWLITNKVQPIPPYLVEAVQPFGEAVVSVRIDVGGQTPYSTQDNQIFVRRGSSNYRPNSEELQRLLLSNKNLFRDDEY